MRLWSEEIAGTAERLLFDGKVRSALESLKEYEGKCEDLVPMDHEELCGCVLLIAVASEARASMWMLDDAIPQLDYAQGVVEDVKGIGSLPCPREVVLLYGSYADALLRALDFSRSLYMLERASSILGAEMFEDAPILSARMWATEAKVYSSVGRRGKALSVLDAAVESLKPLEGSMNSKLVPMYYHSLAQLHNLKAELLIRNGDEEDALDDINSARSAARKGIKIAGKNASLLREHALSLVLEGSVLMERDLKKASSLVNKAVQQLDISSVLSELDGDSAYVYAKALGTKLVLVARSGKANSRSVKQIVRGFEEIQNAFGGRHMAAWEELLRALSEFPRGNKQADTLSQKYLSLAIDSCKGQLKRWKGRLKRVSRRTQFLIFRSIFPSRHKVMGGKEDRKRREEKAKGKGGK